MSFFNEELYNKAEKILMMLLQFVITFNFLQGLYYFANSRDAENIYILLRGFYKLFEAYFFMSMYSLIKMKAW